jgi:hypothetical protein
VGVKEGENGHKKKEKKERNMVCHQKQRGQYQDPEPVNVNPKYRF